MQNQELQKFIQEQITQGVSKEEIKKTLLSVGWAENDIEEELNFTLSCHPEENPPLGEGYEGSLTNSAEDKIIRKNKKKSDLKLIAIITIIIIAISVAGAGAWYYFNGETTKNYLEFQSESEIEGELKEKEQEYTEKELSKKIEIDDTLDQSQPNKVIDSSILKELIAVQSGIVFFFMENGALPKSISELSSNLFSGEFDKNKDYLYAYMQGEETLDYHLGVKLDSNDLALKEDNDFNSISAGYVNGFDGADPIYDIVTPEELKESYRQIEKRSEDAIKKSDLANLRLAVEMYFDNNQFYPRKFADISEYLSGGENSDVLQRAKDSNYLYAVSANKKSYHLGTILYSDGSDQIGGDSDFNSLEAGFDNGFDGADPIYDIYSGSM